ncbi:hypothetical protein [Nocardia aurea]|uniref:hypothetical protein n=1 Tax=Nocardia aurea TaxID=2144174 RepID=UPI0033AC6A94
MIDSLVSSIRVSRPRGNLEYRCTGMFTVGVIVERPDSVRVVPRIGLDPWQEIRLMAAAEAVWLGGREAFWPHVWREVPGGGWVAAVRVRAPRAALSTVAYCGEVANR